MFPHISITPKFIKKDHFPRRPFNPGRPGQPCPAFAYITDRGKVLEGAHFGIALLAFGID
jgi:hypothetical protein